jgi:hypothetical protein
MHSIIPTRQISEPLLHALHARTLKDPLLAHQEGHLKVEAMRTLLSLGYTLQEGSPRNGNANFATPHPDMPDVPVWHEGKRLISVDGGSSDLVALKDGGYRQFELKTRCDHGTKSAAATNEIAADLHRVANHEGFTFIGVFDEGIYRSFSGDKSERRGRKASKPGLTGIFPKSGALIVGKITSFQFDFEGVPMHGLAVRQDVPGNGVRVIVVVDRVS